MRISLAGVVLVALSAVSCQQIQSPVAPSSLGGSSSQFATIGGSPVDVTAQSLDATCDITFVSSPPGSSDVIVGVSIASRIYREATKNNRAHQVKADVTYDSGAGTTETISTTILVSAATFIRTLSDKRSELGVPVPRGSLPAPAGTPNYVAACELVLAPKPGGQDL